MPFEIPQEDWYRVKACVEGLDKTINGNGKPPLWERVKDYVDQRDTHKERNMQQEMIDLREEINDKHKENKETSQEQSKKIDKLMQLVYIGFGIVLTLESVGLFKK